MLDKENKEKTYENEIPVYLKEIVEQLDPAAVEIIFFLSEQYRKQYEKSLFKNEDDLKLADDLLNFSAEKEHPQSMEKKFELLKQTMDKKLASQIEDEENKKKQENQSSFNFNSRFRTPEENSANKIEEDDYKL